MTNSQQYQGFFLHAIDLDDLYSCLNFTRCGKIWSPDYLAACDKSLAKFHPNIKEIPMDKLSKFGVPQGILSPRAACLTEAAILRNGGRLGEGTINTKWFTREKSDQIKRIADIELDFEAERRKVAPKAVSRLSCLWVAEDSVAGRKLVESMFPDRVVLNVCIPRALGVSKVDVGWFDKYAKEKNRQYIHSYWMGTISDDNNPKWEYLVDGELEISDKYQLEVIRQYGAHKSIE